MLTQSGDYRDRSKVVSQGLKGLDGRPRKGVDDMCIVECVACVSALCLR